MGVFQTIRAALGMKAALPASAMTKQMSKSTNTNNQQNQFRFTYKEDGLTFEDYDEMLKDPQIKSGYELIRMFLLSRKLHITPATDEETDIEIAEYVENMFMSMKYPMRKIRNDMYSAIIYGYSVSEIIWESDEAGETIDLRRLRPIPISTLQDCFRYDDYGDLESIIQTVDGEDEIIIPAEKCLVYTYDEKFGDRRGTSILDSVYENWFNKQKILNWWNVFLQKHEGPTLVGKLENPVFKEDMLDQLEEVQEGRTNMTIGMNDSIEILETSHRGEGFKDAIDYHDVMIFRKMNIGTMLLGQQDGSGAYAQSKTQNDVLDTFLDGIHEDIAAELNVLVKELVDMNWTVEEYPTVEFESFEDVDILALMNALEPYVRNMAIDTNSMWFKQLLADVISRFSNVDTDELLEETNTVEPMVKPTFTQKTEDLPDKTNLELKEDVSKETDEEK
jgi:hypothetical protein